MSTPTAERPARDWEAIPRYATAREVAAALHVGEDLVYARWADAPHTLDVARPGARRRCLRFCKGCVEGRCPGATMSAHDEQEEARAEA